MPTEPKILSIGHKMYDSVYNIVVTFYVEQNQV